MCLYLLLTLFVIASGVAYLTDHPQLLERWWADVWSGNWKPGMEPRSPGQLGRCSWACVPMFPPGALGLSGFELTLMAMPLVRGMPDDSPEKPARHDPQHARAARGRGPDACRRSSSRSTLVTTVLIPTSAAASRRAGEVPGAGVPRPRRRAGRRRHRRRAHESRSSVWRSARLRRQHGGDLALAGLSFAHDAGVVDSAVPEPAGDGVPLVGEARACWCACSSA